MIISVVDLHSTKLNNNNFACLTCIPVYFSMHYLGSGFSILYGKFCIKNLYKYYLSQFQELFK